MLWLDYSVLYDLNVYCKAYNLHTCKAEIIDIYWNYDLPLCAAVKEEAMDRAKSYYHKVCQQLNLVPISYFMRHMNDPTLTMRFHGLSASETMAIALALKVW